MAVSRSVVAAFLAVAVLCVFTNPVRSEAPINLQAEETYDYIVVGAGASGSAVAARLAEDSSVTVLLLEAGEDFRSSETPRYLQCPNPIMGTDRPELAKYQYVNMTATHTSAQEPGPWIRGRGLGGSTLVNGQIAIRGRPDDYDFWQKKYNAQGWTWDKVLPYFNKLENDLNYGDKPYHGNKGPVPVYRAPKSRWGAVDRAHATAAMEMGLGWTDDNNSPTDSGVGYSAINSFNDRRINANDAYLEMARDQPNFEIRGLTTVDRVLFDGETAVGVEAIAEKAAGSLRASAGPKSVRYLARKEVILSAGVIFTPGILLRSGVGPSSKLSALGVKPVKVLEDVGKNLKEHAITNIMFDLTKEAAPPSIEFRTTNVATRFNSTLLSEEDGGINDIGFLSMNVVNDMTMPGDPMGVVSAVLWRPNSLGSVEYKTTDPKELPTITLNLLDNKSDKDRMRVVTRKLIELADHKEFTAISTAKYTFDAAGKKITLDALKNYSDEELDKWIMETAVDGEHSSCTCAMMKVVDERMRVYGLKNLRIVDTSVFPDVPRSNTMLAAFMIGERAADMIREDAHGARSANFV